MALRKNGLSIRLRERERERHFNSNLISMEYNDFELILKIYHFRISKLYLSMIHTLNLTPPLTLLPEAMVHGEEKPQ
jgi:hypothetical protein